jgi:hypothetical protein
MVLAGGVAVFAILRTPGQETALAAAPTDAAAPVTGAQFAEEPTNTVAAAPAEPEQAPSEEEAAAADEPAADEPELADKGSAGAKRKAGKRRERAAERAAADRADKREKSEESEPIARAEKSEKSSDGEKGIGIDELLGEPTKKKGGSSSIDELLDNAVSGKKSPPKAEAAPANDLPKTPSRDDMISALAKAAAKAGKCPGSGVAKAALTVSGAGRATSVNVSGVEGAASSCVEKAFKSVRFPKFQNDSIDVAYPVKLKG